MVLLAQVGTFTINIVALAGVVVGFGLLVIVPVVAIMTEHQRKMARILHGQKDESVEKLEGLTGVINAKLGNSDPVLAEIRALRSEVQEIKAQVGRLTAEQAAADSELRQTLSRD